MHIKFNYSLSAGFRFTIIILMLFLNDYLFTQVRIKEKVVINTQNQPNILKSKNQSELSTGITTITAILNYRACSGYAVLYIDNSPCNSYNNSATGPNVNGYGDSSGIVKFTVNAYDYGVYSFGITSYLSCPPYTSTCGFSTNCKHSVTIKDNNGFSNTIPGDGPKPQGVAYFNNTSNICTDVQPQTLTENSIEMYKEGDYFYPAIGSPPIIVTGCNLRRAPGRQGVTYVMPGLPQGDNYGGYTWTPQDAINLDLCLDINQNVWRIKVNNLRVPIFASSCIRGFIDLGDGCDPNILSQYINSMDEYWTLLHDISWWEIGPYRQIGSAPKKYAFSSGIEGHEDAHLAVTVMSLPKYFNAAFDSIFNRTFPKSLYPCAKNAKDAGDFITRNDIRNAVEKAHRRSEDMSPFDNLKEELDADDFARIEYKLIRMCVEEWAKVQPWYQQ